MAAAVTTAAAVAVAVVAAGGTVIATTADNRGIFQGIALKVVAEEAEEEVEVEVRRNEVLLLQCSNIFVLQCSTIPGVLSVLWHTSESPKPCSKMLLL